MNARTCSAILVLHATCGPPDAAGAHVRKGRRVTERLVNQRLLLRQDADRYIEAAANVDIGLPRGTPRDDDDEGDDD